MAEIKDYLQAKTADHSGVLEIPPQAMMLDTGEYPQKLLETDGTTIHVITLEEIPDFYVEVDFAWLNAVDTGIIFDLYFNPLKAKGMARTFYWRHPTDTNIYVVRFMDKLERKTAYHQGYKTIKLKIEGYRA